jgi:hypothetical protein
MSAYDVKLSGPFFDGRADDAVDMYCTDVRSDLATRGLIGVMTVLASPHPTGIRERTPYYETQLNIAGNANTDESLIVNDNMVLYGKWLEGIGSRNWPVTRFRGYHAFAHSFVRVQESVPHVTTIHMGHALRKMN